MARKTFSILSTFVLLAPLVCLDGHADEPTRLDVMVLVNREARSMILEPDNHHLTIETLKIPRSTGETGGACGAVVSLRRKPNPAQKGSYRAQLIIENGRLAVGAMTTFFMSVEELLELPLCK